MTRQSHEFLLEFVRKMLQREGYRVIADGKRWKASGTAPGALDTYPTKDAAWKACRDDYYRRKEHA